MLKRSFDFIAALLGLMALSPVFVLVAVWIKLHDHGPVFYRGLRAGRYGRPFRILKFRTMVVNAEKRGGSCTADTDPRITPAGKLLRKWKLDELPQLVNVLLGEMSLVGPRPEVQEYVDLYTDEEQAILQLRPGITDWASLWDSDEGAVLARFDDPEKAYLEHIRPTKLRLQLDYARHHPFWIDLVIIGRTLVKICRKDRLPPDLASIGDVTMRSSI
jgi:lipopolysaccharide/colanic/teichoic acid biosynthesis glycosyltransferase